MALRGLNGQSEPHVMLSWPVHGSAGKLESLDGSWWMPTQTGLLGFVPFDPLGQLSDYKRQSEVSRLHHCPRRANLLPHCAVVFLPQLDRGAACPAAPTEAQDRVYVTI